MPVSSPWYLSATPITAAPWLTRLRATTAVVCAVVVAIALAWPSLDFPLRQATPLVALAGVVHGLIAVTLARQWAMPAAMVALGALVDVALLGWLLDLTGGPFNPFAVVFAVHVAFAGVTAGRWPAAAVAAGAVAVYGTLLYLHTLEGVAGHHRLNDFPTHLFTMWVSVTATAELAAWFAVQASAALDTMRRRAMRSERLVSLTTLAAGAAHELSTPLATIAVAARELERAAGAEAPALADDARLIRTEVDRCQSILDQMSGRAGGSVEDAPEAVDVVAVLADAARALPGDGGGRVRVEAAPALPAVWATRAGLRQALLSLLANAVEASPAGATVDVRAVASDDRTAVRIDVQDRGAGMAPEVLARAGEPFFSTRAAGRGLGLGLFLARVFAERSGGALAIVTDGGTRVTLDLPAAGHGGPTP
ncbi:MAG: sensor histidine kinase [Vicinamibacterales bacterium]